MAARVWGAPTAKRIGKSPLPDCTACRRPGEQGAAKRKRWGCDAPAERVVFTTGCSRCFGMAEPDEPCPDCQGGTILHHRCPTALLEEADPGERAGVARAFAAYLAWDEHHAPPVAGGWLEQAAAFHQVCTVVGDERGRYNRLEAEHRESERRNAESKRSQGRAGGARQTTRRR